MPATPPIHTEVYRLDDMGYDLTVYQVEDGLIGRWVCEVCGRNGGPDTATDSLVAALRRVQDHLYGHHNLHLLGELSLGRNS